MLISHSDITYRAVRNLQSLPQAELTKLVLYKPLCINEQTDIN